MPNVISLFSGCGGLDLGFEQAGYDIIYANEFDKTIHSTYELNHPDTTLIKDDIRNVSFTGIVNDDIDGIIGGPPCQSWSVAGKQRGIQDARGMLFYEYIRILTETKPKFFLAENVKGLLSKKHANAYRNILDTFENAGYRVTAKLVNAADYGTAEDRLRLIIVGIREDIGREYSFPDGSTSDDNKKKTLRDVIYDLRESAVPSLDKQHHNPVCINNHEYYVGGYSPRYLSANRKRAWDEQSFTIQCDGRHAPLHPDSPDMVQERDPSGHKYRQFHFEYGQEDAYRRLSVRECARIQGFPDDFKFIYKSSRTGYKMIGNAVPVPLANELAESIKRFL